MVDISNCVWNNIKEFQGLIFKNHLICWNDKIHLLLFYSLESFSYQCQLMVFHWSLSDNKSPQDSRTLLSILVNFNKAVVWMVSTCPLISKTSGPCTKPLVTVPRAPVTIGITVTFMFHSFFNFLARPKYLAFFSLSFTFALWSTWTANPLFG